MESAKGSLNVLIKHLLSFILKAESEIAEVWMRQGSWEVR